MVIHAARIVTGMRNSGLVAALAGALLVTAAPVAAQPGKGPHGGRHHDPAKFFQKLDTDGDGAISLEEIKSGRAKHAEGIDANADGFISSDELAAQRTKRAEGRAAGRFEKFTEHFDANGDGKVATQEFLDHTPPFFGKADTDGDGKLTQEEMRAMHEMRKMNKMNKHGGPGPMHDR